MEIPLTGKHGKGQFALIDDEDWEALHTAYFRDGTSWTGRVCDLKWYLRFQGEDKTPYVLTRTNQKTIGISRLIMETPSDLDCDHIRHNRFDNRKSELRNATRSQNLMNMRRGNLKSENHFKGVKIGETKKGFWSYRTYIVFEGKPLNVFSGTVSNPQNRVKAGFAYNVSAKILFGEFACLNDIPEDSLTENEKSDIREKVNLKLKKFSSLP